MCFTKFAVTFDVASDSIGEMNNCDDNVTNVVTSAHHCSSNNGTNILDRSKHASQKIKLKDNLGYMRKRRQEAILHTRRYKVNVEPEKYYHAKLLLCFPWCREDELISGFTSYFESYMSKVMVIQKNAEHFNDDCDLFDIANENLENGVTQTAWDSVAPTIPEGDNRCMLGTFQTLQDRLEETSNENICSPSDDKSTKSSTNPLSMLYAKAAKRQNMSFHEYCSHVRMLNKEQKDIIMYSRAWCKSCINSLKNGRNKEGYRIYLSGLGGVGKSHVLHLIQRDMSYLHSNVLNVQLDQPIVLVTASTGSAAYHIGGSTIHSAFLMHDDSKWKPSWEKHMIMQLKLEHMILSVTDEISMVGFKQFQHMNQIVCDIKGTTDANWGGICVLAVGDLYQLPPVGQSPVYMSSHNFQSMNDFAPNGWEQMQLHELTQIMRQKDMSFA